MAKSLKQRNQPQLMTFVLANVIALGLIALGVPRLIDILQDLSKGDWKILGKLVAIPAFSTLVISTVGWAMPRVVKEVLVFWKSKNGLPSSRAFTTVGPSDPRVDMRWLSRKYDPLPSKPASQTGLWYRIYRTHREDVSVEDAHGAYLRFREMATLCVALAIAHVTCAAALHFRLREIVVGILLIIGEYLILVIAARNAATRLVSNVLAIESAVRTENTTVARESLS